VCVCVVVVVCVGCVCMCVTKDVDMQNCAKPLGLRSLSIATFPVQQKALETSPTQLDFLQVELLRHIDFFASTRSNLGMKTTIYPPKAVAGQSENPIVPESMKPEQNTLTLWCKRANNTTT